MISASIQLYLRHKFTRLTEEVEIIYVDNVLLGADSYEAAIRKYSDLKALFRRMHINLREFLCNSIIVNRSIKEQGRILDVDKAALLGIA